MNYASISASTLFVSFTGLMLCLESAPEAVGERISADSRGLSQASVRLAKARLQDTDLALCSFIEDQ